MSLEILSNIQLERTCLGGLINHPQTLVELDNLYDKDFSNHVHKVIFSVLKQMVLKGDKIEKVVLAQKIIEIGIRFFEEIDIYTYIEDASFSQIQPKGILEISKELTKLRIKREIYENANAIQNYIKNSKDDSINKIIAQCDKIYNEKINTYESEEEPLDLFSEAENIINDRVKNPIKPGILSPFPIFNEMFGGFRDGISAICGRAKNNKSTVLLNVGFGAILKDLNLSVLYLDTELKAYDHVFRSMAALSQIHTKFLEEGTWIKNKELAGRLNNSWKISNQLKKKLYHQYVGNRSIEEISSIIRKWYLSKVGRGNPGLIIFDYIKIGNEKLSNYNNETQELGRKINTLNELSHKMSVPILSSMQLNRSAIIDQRDDEAAISMTDRLSWFANGVFIFRKKRTDEISEEGIEFGTHKLIPVVTRYQGNSDLLDFVEISNDHGKRKWKQNFINFNFSNFLLEERGTLRDIIRHQRLQANLQTNTNQNQDHIHDL